MQRSVYWIALFSLIFGIWGSSWASAVPHPADTSGDYQLSANEFTNYTQAYKLQQAWPAAPSPPSVSYYTRALYLFRHGGRYIQNASSCPLCWVFETGGNQPPIADLNFYDHGNSTDEEQMYLEYINRARANPPQEAVRMNSLTDLLALFWMDGYFRVNRTLMMQQISAYPAVPPVAMNTQLVNAARWYSEDMRVNGSYSHIGSDGSNPGLRISNAGYAWNTYGEAAYNLASNPINGHAGFIVDWGCCGAGGMQSPAGHRTVNLNGNYKEVGVGVSNGFAYPTTPPYIPSRGPQYVTEDFARRWDPLGFIMGVIYYDYNSNGVYDIGEGIDGVIVTADNSTYYTFSSYGGGYSLPTATAGSTVVHAWLPHGERIDIAAALPGLQNVKVDFKLAYQPIVINGPLQVGVGQGSPYSSSPLSAASSYEWHVGRLATTYFEGAENGVAQVIAVNTSVGGIATPLIVTSPVASGRYAFHFVHPFVADQYIILNDTFIPHASTVLRFMQRLGWATAVQEGRVELSVDDGTTWTVLWSKRGDSTAGSGVYTQQNISLASYAQQAIRLRFIYKNVREGAQTGGTYFQTTEGMGFYVDDIQIDGVKVLKDSRTSITTEPLYIFTPTVAGEHALFVRARTPQRPLRWGEPLIVNVLG